MQRYFVRHKAFGVVTGAAGLAVFAAGAWMVAGWPDVDEV
jgi:uncharacterized membrane protein (DUF4010 family)